MSDHAESAGGDAFTPEEQAAFDAYETGADVPADAPGEPVGGAEPVPAAVAAPAAVAPAPAAPGESAAAPGDVVDPDAEDADDPEANKGRFVRHGAFHKERERRKAVERSYAELQERYARGDERMRLLTEALQRGPHPAAAATPAAPAEPEKVPDPNEDIFGYVQHLEKKLADIASGQQQMTEAQKQAQESERVASEERAVISTYQDDVRRVAAADPTFVDAYRSLLEGRAAELRLYGLDDAAIAKAVRDDELALVRSSIQRGVSPAEQVFAMAKARGFTPKPAEPVTPPAPAETSAEKAARISAGQAASKSLSAAGGGPAGEVTLDMLASMSEADFEKFSSANPARVRALMGG